MQWQENKRERAGAPLPLSLPSCLLLLDLFDLLQLLQQIINYLVNLYCYLHPCLVSSSSPSLRTVTLSTDAPRILALPVKKNIPTHSRQ